MALHGLQVLLDGRSAMPRSAGESRLLDRVRAFKAVENAHSKSRSFQLLADPAPRPKCVLPQRCAPRGRYKLDVLSEERREPDSVEVGHEPLDRSPDEWSVLPGVSVGVRSTVIVGLRSPPGAAHFVPSVVSPTRRYGCWARRTS